uniref:Uncharacterized protein n=1 Tax=Ascaris lumbricoides TaxID=6252 RepID=A0A0M3II31_ASCLU
MYCALKVLAVSLSEEAYLVDEDMVHRNGVHLLLSILSICTLIGSCHCFRCYEYAVRNKVSPDADDIKKPVICEGLTSNACVKVITKNSMKGLAEEVEKAFTTEGRCALYDDECPKSKANKSFSGKVSSASGRRSRINIARILETWFPVRKFNTLWEKPSHKFP